MKPPYLQLLAITALFTGGFTPEARAQDPPIAKPAQAPVFVPFDFYSRYRESLGLNEEQVRELQSIAEGMREAAQKFEGERGLRTRALQEAVEKRPVDVDVAMEHFQAILNAENELKKLQFRGGIEMRNTLSKEQLRKVQVLAAEDSGLRAKDIRMEINNRIQQLKVEIDRQSGGHPSPEIIAQLQKIEQSAREGRIGEAKSQLEQMLRQLRGEPELLPATDKSAPKPGKAPDEKQAPQ